MNNLEKLDIAQSILVDVLYGKNWSDIYYATDLSLERCKEIEILMRDVFFDYKTRNFI